MDRSHPWKSQDDLENVMKLSAVLLFGMIAGIVPALAQTSTSTPAGTAAPKPTVEGSTATTTAPDPAATVPYRGNGSGYQPMGAGGYNPMGHK
jgi:hypothetical protein